MMQKQLVLIGAMFGVLIVTGWIDDIAGRNQVLSAATTPEPVPPEDPVVREGLVEVDALLLTNRKILIELGCDLAQLDRIMERIELAQQRSAAAIKRANVTGPVTVPSLQLRRALAESDQEWRVAKAEVVAEMLTPKQRQRLWEIYLQSGQHRAFLWPVVAKALGLSEKQKELLVENIVVTKARAQSRHETAELAEAKGEHVDHDQSATAVLAEATKRATAILTDKQREQWSKMVGKPFQFATRRPLALGVDAPLPIPEPPLPELPMKIPPVVPLTEPRS